MSDYDDIQDDSDNLTCQYCGGPLDDDFFSESCSECARESEIDRILDMWD